MATAPWRCSQCGTINEPVANSCRTCGKWPSLFDLEDTALEDYEVEAFGDVERVPTFEPPAPVQTHDAPEPLTVDVETYAESETPERRRRFEPPSTDPVFEPEELGEGEGERRPRWVSWIIPIAVAVYFAISLFLGDR